MSENTLNTVGQLLDSSAERDAVHFALAPVIAGEPLNPGQRVDYHDGLTYAAKKSKGVGIVDPFLRDTVTQGERYWLFLYPNTVTGMRHEWHHPAFDSEEAMKLAARDKLYEYASREGLSLEDFIAGLDYGYENGGEVIFGRDHNYAISDGEFPSVWEAYCTYTRKILVSQELIKKTVFRCAC